MSDTTDEPTGDHDHRLRRGHARSYRQKDLRQALYDAGEVVMADVLVNLHAAEHRDRRRLENRLFRRDTIELYERDLFPPIIDETLAPDVAAGPRRTGRPRTPDDDEPGRAHRRRRSPARHRRRDAPPVRLPDAFIEGATLGALHRRPRRQAARGRRASCTSSTPSSSRRRSRAGWRSSTPATNCRSDVLSILLANEDALHLPHDVIVREVAFYLLAGAHTSATAFTRVLHNIFTWLEDHPEDADLVRTDRLFVQRCTHETVRLQPSSPVAMRWALDDIELQSRHATSPRAPRW